MRALLLAAVAAASSAGWLEDLPAGLAEAKKTGRPVLVDFQAPWCYSCYYMERHVLGRPRFREAAARLVLVKLDVDRPEHAAIRRRYAVNALPSYLLLSADGRELGRVVGEQAEDDFLARLATLAGPLTAAQQAAERLRSALGRRDWAGVEVAQRLSPDVEAELAKDPEWRLLRARARLAGDAPKPGAEEALRALIEAGEGCELYYDVGALGKLKAALPAARYEELRGKAVAALETLLDRRVLDPQGPGCADFRTAVEQTAELYEEAGQKEKRDALLGRAIAFLDAKGLPPGEDRNHDDNLRVFLKEAGEDARLRELYEKLVAAYPADYVYAQRYARYLQEKGLNAEALGWAERADKLAYGANRLFVTEVRARILAALGRKEEALRLLARDIKAGRKAFPKYAASLEKARAELSR